MPVLSTVKTGAVVAAQPSVGDTDTAELSAFGPLYTHICNALEA
jgi:hypothetical protein